MLNKKVKKLWLGKFVSIRDYELKNAIRRGGLMISHGKDKMFLDVEKLSTLKPSGMPLQSKFGGTYQLVDITFKPLTEDPNQGRLFDG
tara:strand:- start:622 stop:885 length:264 start_codon:yes stop_codon:yes gene_type:complete